MSTSLHRVCSQTLPTAMASACLLLGLASCTTSIYESSSSTDSPGSSPSAPYSLRYKYGGTWFPNVERRPVEHTTREDFFAWLLGTDSDSSSRKKKEAAPTGPVIPPTKVNQVILARSNKANTRVIVDVGRQTAFLLVDGRVAVETPVSTARTGKYTPRGSFRITERVRSGKISTIYGVGMPYWMRLSGSVYGVHAGYLPGYPASAGCIRLPSDAAQLIYDNTKYGTRVSIYTSWQGAGNPGDPAGSET